MPVIALPLQSNVLALMPMGHFDHKDTVLLYCPQDTVVSGNVTGCKGGGEGGGGGGGARCTRQASTVKYELRIRPYGQAC